MFDRHKINVITEKTHERCSGERTLTQNYETLYLCLRCVDFCQKIILEILEC